MLVGFVHGVMNTDNTTISGETIDYGPCAFMDVFDPATVFSSIDHAGRYAYGNQPAIAQWNLARLGETLLPLIDENLDAAVEAATAVLTSFAETYSRHWAEGMAAKLGLPAPDPDLATDLQELLRTQHVDFTTFFRSLAAGTARSLFDEPEPFDAWATRREALLPADRAAVAAAMNRVNPIYIPRNHLVEEALTAATAGDLAPFRRLVDIVSDPYEQRPGLDDYARPAPAGCAPVRHVLRNLTGRQYPGPPCVRTEVGPGRRRRVPVGTARVLVVEPCTRVRVGSRGARWCAGARSGWSRSAGRRGGRGRASPRRGS